MITQEVLHDWLYFDDEDGYFYNRRDRSYHSLAGQRVGNPKVGGRYIMFKFMGHWHYAHHLAWCYNYGVWPERVDHWDGDGLNNRLYNLREATQSQNMCNAEFPVGASGYRGVYKNNRSGLSWRALIQYENHQYCLGYFDDPEEASHVYLQAAERIHGEFALSNRLQIPRPAPEGTNGTAQRNLG